MSPEGIHYRGHRFPTVKAPEFRLLFGYQTLKDHNGKHFSAVGTRVFDKRLTKPDGVLQLLSKLMSHRR
jgi:hypothetical protein